MKTKAEIRAEATARGEEAKYSGKKKKWFFHKYPLNLSDYNKVKTVGKVCQEELK